MYSSARAPLGARARAAASCSEYRLSIYFIQRQLAQTRAYICVGAAAAAAERQKCSVCARAALREGERERMLYSAVISIQLLALYPRENETRTFFFLTICLRRFYVSVCTYVIYIYKEVREDYGEKEEDDARLCVRRADG